MPDRINPILRNTLSQIAWASIDSGLATGQPLTPSLAACEELLTRPGASFVTLKSCQGKLRGCIGTLVSNTPLAINVSHNAHKAAFSDPRFDPIEESERSTLLLQVSVLSKAVRIEGATEVEVVQQVRPNRDGLIIKEGDRRATFLPAVWESVPDVATFIRQLKLKGGFAEDYWSDRVEVLRYTTESW
ncbi:MAG: AmmeMemoRadiSam system protein A [bacterium]